ncbi:hypothetical protein CPB84DRAFT_1473914 [Gymnopilus junonius]|uniref:Uncharacterized protein n=1 Tax=Gymnopilus junonius TaxID=109634 RepID=A0A9P5NH92_GYMJU|nr:hypothetical protein CPB84DRAFT_1473914 [Gymnopilus junonius]
MSRLASFLQSTTATALSRILGVPYIDMDKIMYQPGWVESPPDEFQVRLREAMAQGTGRGWVVDGNYVNMGGKIPFEESTDVIWLDPPLALYLPRIIWRSILRMFDMTEQCSPGCHQTFSNSLYIIWRCITHHWSSRPRYEARLREFSRVKGTNTMKRKMQRIGGWGGQLQKWLKDVENMTRSK